VVLKGGWIAPGCHVNAVGASVPSVQEIDQQMLLKSALYVDFLPSALAQAREIIDAIASQAMAQSHILGEIGQLFDGTLAGRSSDEAITLYRSLGVAAQDLSCAQRVLANKSGL